MKNPFEIAKRYQDDVVIVALNGYLDAHTAPILDKELEDIIAEHFYKIVIDFSALDYISSAGLGIFMSHIEEVKLNGGDIKMACMKPKVFSVFDLLGFPILYDITQELQHAIDKFSNADIVNG